MGVIFVTHDLGVAGEVADRIAVMYAGRFIEEGPTRGVMRTPLHPYTQGLLGATVHEGMRGSRLTTIPGAPPNLEHPPEGLRVCGAVHLYAKRVSGGGAGFAGAGAGPGGALRAGGGVDAALYCQAYPLRHSDLAGGGADVLPAGAYRAG